MYKCLLFSVSANGEYARQNGTHRIATTLRQQNWDAEVIDFGSAWTLDELKALALSRIDSNTKFIGFGYLMVQYNQVYDEFCLWLKKEFPDIHLIYGSTMLPGFDTEIFDYYVIGFGELGLLALLSYLYSNGPKPRFEIMFNSTKKVINADTNYPAHPLRESRVIYEARDFIQPNEWLATEFSRGCMFKCSFCNAAVLGVKGDYSRDSQDAYLELQDNFDRWGVKNYTISDDTFNDRTEKITKFADVVETLNFKPFFTAFIRADLLAARQKDREELLRMGVNAHFYGIESFNSPTMKAFKKGYDPNKIKQTLLEVKKLFSENGGYRGSIGMIIGGPYETVTTQEDMIGWLNENWSDQNVLPNVLQIYEGKNVTKSLLSESYEKYNYRKMTDEEIKPYEHMKDRVRNFNTVRNNHDKTIDFKILWDNSEYNIFTATMTKDRFFQVNNHRLKLSAFNLSYLSNDTIEDRLEKLNKTRYDNTLIDVSLLQSYKDKKLSL
jgi:radical SAM superfamily enzyme YgiQ (UPF0313 family)